MTDPVTAFLPACDAQAACDLPGVPAKREDRP